jgi:hypothetical protein
VGRSRGGFAAKIGARVDAKVRPVCLLISRGGSLDAGCEPALLDGLAECAADVAARGYDADGVHVFVIKARSPIT